MSALVEELLGKMLQGAQAYWPALTRQQFDDVVESLPAPADGRWSVHAMGDAVWAELTRRYGAPLQL